MNGRDNSPVLFDYPNSRNNVFLMMRFRDTKPHRDLLTALRTSLDHYGLNALRADDKQYSEDLWSNVKSYMDACDAGIAVFEQIDDRDFNPNVSLELGYMRAFKKPVLLLKEKRLGVLPSDVMGSLYKPFDSYEPDSSIRTSVLAWLRDIGIAKSPAERVVLFISHGGTCRCAMAKVVLEQLLQGRQLPFRLRVISVAHKYGGTDEASRGARRAVYDAYGLDLLEQHRVTRRNPGLLEDADLVLTMEEVLREDLPATKTHNFKGFLGGEGDVRNPWPDDEDAAALARYRECMSEIRETLERGVDRILERIT